jgi:hypothetical protein
MSDEMTYDKETQAVFDDEDRIMQVAHRDIVKYPPVTLFPAGQAARMLRDYEKFLENTAGLTRAEVETMVFTDLRLTVDILRSTLINLHFIGPVRSAVLLHVALFLGVGPLQRMTELFDALRKKDYDAAYRHLMLSAWPALVGINPSERMRVLNLAEQLRTGRTAPENTPSEEKK